MLSCVTYPTSMQSGITLIDPLLKRAEEYHLLFTPSRTQLRRCYASFLNELQAGLEQHAKDPNNWHPEKCSLMMLDCCIDFVPSGKEKGVFYAIDFGGTNLRAIRCTLDGMGNASIKALKHNMRNANISEALPKGLLDKKATASMLFDSIAGVVDDLIKNEGDSKLRNVGVGFTFSFGINQQSLTSAILTGWTKDFETGMATNDPIIGRDVCALLDNAFERRNMSAKVSAVLNDTVGAMLSGSYCKSPEMPPCLVGVILGTGMNGAYVQPDAKHFGYQGVVMNTELGGFNKDLPENDIDMEVDFNSTACGRQRFEKMCSGMYIPELVRLLLLRVFQNAAPATAWIEKSFTGEGCGAILNDHSPYTTTATVLRDLWDWTPSQECLRIVHRLVSVVFRRSAAVSAVAIAAMAKATGRLQTAMGGLTVGIDGSLYTLNPTYRDAVREYLEMILTKKTADLIHTVVAEDGSGKGAAVLAATLACRQS